MCCLLFALDIGNKNSPPWCNREIVARPSLLVTSIFPLPRANYIFLSVSTVSYFSRRCLEIFVLKSNVYLSSEIKSSESRRFKRFTPFLVPYPTRNSISDQATDTYSYRYVSPRRLHPCRRVRRRRKDEHESHAAFCYHKQIRREWSDCSHIGAQMQTRTQR